MPKIIRVSEEGLMWRRPPIWEPGGTRFRPYSLSTLIFFYLGKLFGRLFGRGGK